ncbi:MAG: glycosyltransferase [Bacteroidales bacterium]|nr:glycosyltransferase [Bacteroidales bacterium]
MNILYYGSHYWDRGPWFRKQHFAKNLANRGHKVFYIEMSVSAFRLRKNHKNKLWKTLFNKVDENITVITPSAFFPFPHSRFIRNMFNRKLVNDIKRYFKKKGIEEFIFWFNIIPFSNVVPKLGASRTIFDLSDDVPLFYQLAGDEKRNYVYSQYLKQAYELADIAIVTAVKIKEKYQHLTNKEIIVIPNGHSYTSFHGKEKEPGDVKDIAHPRLGFLGTLFRFTDEEVLEFMIKSRPEYNFVFVGKVEKSFPLERIKHYKNVHILGPKDKEDVDKYISSFDICLNPFKIHEVNDSVSPLKVFEYLAFRKHVVSSYMYSLQKEKISKHIRFGGNKEEQLQIIDEIVKSGDFVNHIPEEELLEYNWDNLFLQLAEKVKEQYGFEL